MTQLSLIVCTMRRQNSLGRLIESLANQTMPPTELVIVVQSNDRATFRFAENYAKMDWPFAIRLVGNSTRSLSAGRNLGLREARGEIIGFPDDDCEYERGTCERVARAFSEEPNIDVLIGAHVSSEDGQLVRGPRTKGIVFDQYSIWRDVISITLFARRKLFSIVGGFNERLGVGAETMWLGGEESEWVLRAVLAGCVIVGDPSVRVRHARDALGWRKAYKYARGMGFVLGAYECYSVAYRAYFLLRPAVGAALSFAKGDWRRGVTRAGRALGLARGMLDARAARVFERADLAESKRSAS